MFSQITKTPGADIICISGRSLGMAVMVHRIGQLVKIYISCISRSILPDLSPPQGTVLIWTHEDRNEERCPEGRHSLAILRGRISPRATSAPDATSRGAPRRMQRVRVVLDVHLPPPAPPRTAVIISSLALLGQRCTSGTILPYT